MLTKLQQKPERVREQIAVFAAGGVTLVIIAVWVLSLGGRLKNPQTVLADGTVVESVQPEKPFTLFFSSLASGLKEQRQKLKENNPLQHDEADPALDMVTAETVLLEPQSDGSQPADTGEAASLQSAESTNDMPQDTTQIDASKEESAGENVVE